MTLDPYQLVSKLLGDTPIHWQVLISSILTFGYGYLGIWILEVLLYGCDFVENMENKFYT